MNLEDYLDQFSATEQVNTAPHVLLPVPLLCSDSQAEYSKCTCKTTKADCATADCPNRAAYDECTGDDALNCYDLLLKHLLRAGATCSVSYTRCCNREAQKGTRPSIKIQRVSNPVCSCVSFRAIVDSDVQVSASIGFGVFADTDIAPGTYVGTYLGKVSCCISA